MDRDHNNQQQPPEQQQHRQLYPDQSTLVQPQTNQQTTHITAVRLQHTNQEHAYYNQDVHKMKRHPELQPYVPSDRFITFSAASGSSTIKHNNVNNNNNSYTKSPSNYCGNKQQQVYSNNHKTGDSSKTSSSASVQPKRHVSMTRLNQLAQPKKRNVTASTPAATTKPQPPSPNSSTRSLYSPNNRKPFNTSNKNSANGLPKQNQKTTVAWPHREDKEASDRRLRNEKELSEKFISKLDVDEEAKSTKIEEELREKARLAEEEEEDRRRIALEQELLEKAKLEEKEKEQERKLKSEKARLDQEEEEKRLRIEEEIREKARLEEEERKERDQIVENILSRFSQGSVS